MPSKPPGLKKAPKRKAWVKSKNKPDSRIRGRRGQALRQRRLADEPLCRLCGEEGRVTIADVVDHIQPLALGGEDVDENCRSLCHAHHAAVTAEQFDRSSKAIRS